MKFLLSTSDMTKLNILLNIQEDNIELGNFYCDYLLSEDTIINPEQISKIMQKDNVTKEAAFYKSLITKMNLDPQDEELNRLNASHHIDNIKILDKERYIEDPYYKNITIPYIRQKAWTLKKEKYDAYSAFLYKEIEVKEPTYEECSCLGFFKEDFAFPCVIQNNRIWMSITPHEIETMKKPIQNASGRVLMYGLGMGYFAYMCSNKANVDSITIIEKDEVVISLFEEYILPQFNFKNKIKIIKSDAFDYTKHNNEYDYIFVDLWHDENDGIVCYINMKYYQTLYNKPTYDYWIEDTLICYLRRCLSLLIYEELNESLDYSSSKCFSDTLINTLHSLFEKTTFTTYKEIVTLFSNESLKDIASKLGKAIFHS